MTEKITGQQGITSRTNEPIRGDMDRILPDVKRAGALRHQQGSFHGREWLRTSTRIIAIFALASMSLVGFAQDADTTSTESAAQEAPAATPEPAAPEPAGEPVAEEGQAEAEAAQAEGEAAGEAGEAEEGEPGEGVSVVASNLPVERVLGQLADQSGAAIAARGKTPGTRVTLIQPKKIPLKDALNQIVNSQPNWLLYEPRERPGSYEIWDTETYQAEVLPRLVRPKVFIPREITAEEAAKALEGIMTPGIGRVAPDPRSNKVIMTDLVPVLELAQRLLETIDVKFYTRVYYIEHADVNAVAEKISGLKSPAAPDVQVDERTRQIIVSDRIDILQKMEGLVETLDIGPEMRVYTINNLGVEGDELEELEVAIEELLTPEAYFHFNVRQGKLIVRDLPEVQERVEQVLAAFDAPVRQILLQLEIIETEFSDGFNWQVDYAFSGDLLGAVTDGLVSGIPTGGTPDPDGGFIDGTEGFVNFRKEFPVVEAGSKGLNATMLSRHAFVKLQTAMSDSRTRILQQPRMLVENQKMASFDVGQSVPFFTGGSIGVSQSGSGVLTPSQPVQQLLQVGLYVEVIPIISANGLVELEITVENSTPLRVEQTFGGEAYTGVGKTNQELVTTMWVPSGATRVIGGLVSDSKSEARSGIPGLMKIPFIGPALFGSYTKSPEDNRRRNLLIFVTPTIVEESPSDPNKYKGVLMASLPQDELTTPSATITDMPYRPNLSNLAQLEKGDYLSYTPPPMPDFEAMARTRPVEDDAPLRPVTAADDPPSLSGIEATVNINQPTVNDLNSAVPSGMTELPRVNLEEQANPDAQLESLIGVRAPSGVLTTGGQNLLTPRESAAPAASSGGQAAKATPRPSSGGRTTTPPARDTR